MSLLDELAAERAGRPVGNPCGVAQLYERLDAATTSELRAALGDTTMPGTIIADVLARRGYDVSHRSLQRHRKHGSAAGCKCESL